MLDRQQKGDRALLVHPEFSSADTSSEDLSEFAELVRSAGIDVAGIVETRRAKPDPAYCVGSGKADEIALEVDKTGADLILVNFALTPTQERNLEKHAKCRVHDRTTLILDIFAQRARSHEGKIQVELAQLRHLSTRLVRGWTHLERQKGGIGLRGPGETQLETDRRLLAVRVKNLRKRLDKVVNQREQSRRGRKRGETPVVALVGYTNAGKSTLFNRLTDAKVYAADQLFATLDPTLRKLVDVNGTPTTILLADTVGFIRHLPHDLVAAFRATLQEAREADLMLHVVDASDPRYRDNMAEVDEVLAQINANEVPQMVVMNKIDRTDVAPRVDHDDDDRPVRAWVSALDGAGCRELVETISAEVRGDIADGWLHLPASAGRLRSKLFELGSIVEERPADDGGWDIHVSLLAQHQHLLHEAGLTLNQA